MFDFPAQKGLACSGADAHFYSAGRIQMRPGTSSYTQLIHCANSTPDKHAWESVKTDGGL